MYISIHGISHEREITSYFSHEREITSYFFFISITKIDENLMSKNLPLCRFQIIMCLAVVKESKDRKLSILLTYKPLNHVKVLLRLVVHVK